MRRQKFGVVPGTQGTGWFWIDCGAASAGWRHARPLARTYTPGGLVPDSFTATENAEPNAGGGGSKATRIRTDAR